MRKLKLQMQISMDGFVAGPADEMDWMLPETDPAQLQVLNELTESMDIILMGRKMAEGFCNYWEGVVDNQPGSPEYPYAKIFVDTPKIIFSKTIGSAGGRNTAVENGELVTAVNNLKNRKGKDLIVYGGADFVSALIKNNLIDELYLFVHPVALGQGRRIFHDRTAFTLIRSTVCGNGVTINQYRLNRSAA